MRRATLWDHCFEVPRTDPVLTAKLAAGLVRHGVSEAGTRQALAGEAVSDVTDRLRLAKVVEGGLGRLAATPRQLEIALLVPAVQSGLSAPTKPQAGQTASLLEGLGLSAAGAGQFLAGLPVTAPDDRARLVRALAAALGTTWGGLHRGGMNAVLMDGSVR